MGAGTILVLVGAAVLGAVSTVVGFHGWPGSGDAGAPPLRAAVLVDPSMTGGDLDATGTAVLVPEARKPKSPPRETRPAPAPRTTAAAPRTAPTTVPATRREAQPVPTVQDQPASGSGTAQSEPEPAPPAPGDGVEKIGTTLGDGLDKTVSSVGDAATPVSPTVGQVVDDAGTVVGDTVKGLTNTVGVVFDTLHGRGQPLLAP